MSFLFGRKEKDKKGSSREIGPPTPAPAAARDNQKLAPAPQPQNPVNSVNTSLNSVGSDSIRRPDPDRQVGSRPGTSSGQSNTANANLYPWSQRHLYFSGVPSPFPRYGAAVNAVASKEGDVYVMGGLINGQTVKGDLWMVEAGSGNLNCYPVRTEAEGPGPRVGHASLLVGNAFIIFGGDTKQDESDPLDDTLYLLNTSTKQWSRALPPGPRPAGRYGHTLNILGSRLYVFGGQVDGHFFNDLLAFDLNQLQSSENRWELLVPDSTEDASHEGPIPLGRTNHSMVAWNDRLYLFGGTDGAQWFNDVWTYDPQSNSWSQLDCIGYIPQPREGHSAALVNDVMYVFGGRTQEGDDLGDLAAFRITSRRWYTFQNMGPAPSPRSGHSMTAYDKQIVVLAGEPSSVQRDPHELSMVYMLDTAKIRYPDDQQIQQTPTGERVAGNRRPSTDRPSTDRAPSSRGMVPREPLTGGAPPASRLPRASSVSQPSPGPPSQQQAPASRANVSAIPTPGGQRTRTPTKEPRNYGQSPEASRGPSFERQEIKPDLIPSVNEGPRAQVNRSLSPAGAVRQQQPPPQQVGSLHPQDQAPVPPNGAARNQLQPRQVQPITSFDDDESDEDEQELRPQATHNSLGPGKVPNPSNIPSTNLGADSQLAALKKQIDELQARNQTCVAELVAARKAGYNFSDTGRVSVTGPIEDEGRRTMEHLEHTKSMFHQMQNGHNPRLELLMKRVTEVEQQREVAVRDAANARAQLAAHIDSPSGSPRLGGTSRDIESSEGTSGASRKLAAVYARHSELEAQLAAIDAQLKAEKRSREVAESNANALQKRAMEWEDGRNPAELESLRAELFEAHREARDSTSQLHNIQSQSKMLEIDNEDLKRQLADSTGRFSDHGTMLASLREAVSTSEEKYTLLDKKLQQEREDKENLQMKLAQLRTDHEERTAELETTSRRLRDAEELAEKHAGEAQKHRNVVLAGLDKLNAKSIDNPQGATQERKIVTLQQQVRDVNALLTKAHSGAEQASEKVRSAEERIAGLESYQQQTSKENLTLRKQLQDAVRTAQSWQSQYTEARSNLESHQRNASAMGVQHSALRDIVEGRSASATRSLDSPSGDRGLEVAKLRELEHMLEESRKAHDESKASFEATQQDSEKAYRGKLAQLEHDYQSAVTYVKGTEKMLKRMKDELTKSKAQNARLQADMEKVSSGDLSRGGSETPAGWERERQGLQQEIEKMQESLQTSIHQLENQVSEVRVELHNAEQERDAFRSQNDHLTVLTQQTHADLEKLKHDNATLEARAADAEHKVILLLDQMENSVDNLRRQSQMQLNGSHHARNESNTSTYTGGANHSQNNSIGGESFSTTGIDRNSMALDSLANELETLRTQWEGTHRTYRLSNNFDFDREPANGGAGSTELSTSLASWRKRLEDEEKEKHGTRHAKAPAAAGGS